MKLTPCVIVTFSCAVTAPLQFIDPPAPPLDMVVSCSVMFSARDSLCFLLLREFLRLASPLNCGAWDKKLLKQYRVHKPSSLSFEPEMRSELSFEISGHGFFCH
jgi:hypothetical protein